MKHTLEGTLKENETGLVVFTGYWQRFEEKKYIDIDAVNGLPLEELINFTDEVKSGELIIIFKENEEDALQAKEEATYWAL